MSIHRRAVTVRDLHARRRLLRAAFASSGALLGWALASGLPGATPADGSLVVGVHLSADADAAWRSVLPAMLAALAVAAGALAVRAPDPEPDDAGRALVADVPGLSIAWIVAGAAAAVHLPGPAIVCALVGGLLFAALARRERTALDPLLAVAGCVACFAAGATTPAGVAAGDAFVAAGTPTTGGWHVLADLPGAALVAAGGVLALVLVARCAGVAHARRDGSAHPAFLLAALGLVAGVGVTVLGETRWEFGWHQAHATVYLAVFTCALAGLRVIGGWRERQRSLDADGAAAAAVLVAGAVGLGVGGSFLAFLVPVAWFYRTRGETPARWARGRPSGLASRIRPAPWPSDRSTGARPKQPYGSIARGGGP